MPKQKRWAVKRDLDRSDEYLNHAQDYLAKWGHEYQSYHPELYDAFVAAVNGIELVKGLVSRIRESI